MVKLKIAAKILLALVRGWLWGEMIDPIEVFYDKSKNEVFPIISKSGSSSVKSALIKQYDKNFEEKFPEIHLVDPVRHTGVIERLFFSKLSDYEFFCAKKKLIIVIRNPHDRFVSLYVDLKVGKNILYKYPARFDLLFGNQRKIDWKKFLRIIQWVPDKFADRHFRSQSFFLYPGIVTAAESVIVVELQQFLELARFGEKGEYVRLNRNEHFEQKSEILKELKYHNAFNARYSKDIAMFKEIRQP